MQCIGNEAAAKILQDSDMLGKIMYGNVSVTLMHVLLN